jgi:3-phenylpropionate/trans-cinnamate dioxygenase ferredoxin subunit
MPRITITVRNNGPFRVELEEGAELVLQDHDGNPIAFATPRFSLCRCGGSVKKPFCDGTHSKIGFQGAEAARQEYDRQILEAGGDVGNRGNGV